MALSSVAGMPTASGASVPNVVWSRKVLEKFYNSTVFSQIANTDWEGEIKKFGDKVKIRTIPDVTIFDLSRGQKLNYQNLVHGTVDLDIDQWKAYAVSLNDADDIQSDLDMMEDFTMDAAEQLDVAVDDQILDSITAQLASTNKGTTAGLRANFNFGTASSAVALDKTNVLDYIVDMSTALTELKYPKRDRWLLIPPAVAGLIEKSDLKDASLSGDATSILRTKTLGTISGFTLFESNQLPYVSADSAYRIFAGHKSALTFAAQAKDHEVVRATDEFADYMRGYLLYGSNVNKTDGIFELYASA